MVSESKQQPWKEQRDVSNFWIPKPIHIEEEKEGDWSRFRNVASHSQYVVCAEEHGSVENWQVYRTLLETGLFNVFAYELFDSWQESIREYVGHKKPFPAEVLDRWLGRGVGQLNDGKVSHEFLGFLDWISEFSERQKVSLVLFDASSYPHGFSWNERDRIMNVNIQKARDVLQTQGPWLLGTGKRHARISPFVERNERRIPLAHHLKQSDSVVSVNFDYKSGEVFNTIKKKRRNRAQTNDQPFVLSCQSLGQRYKIAIKKSHPIHLIDNL